MVSVGRSAAWFAVRFSASIVLLCLVVATAGSAVAQQARVEITNQTSNAVDVVWLNNGQRQKLGTLQPAQSVTITTTVGHRFMLLSGGAVLSQHTVSGQPGERFAGRLRRAVDAGQDLVEGRYFPDWNDIPALCALFGLGDRFTIRELDKARRRLASELHPDRSSDLPEHARRAREEMLKNVNGAYERLRPLASDAY